MSNANYFNLKLNSEYMLNYNRYKKYIITKIRFFISLFFKKFISILKYYLKKLIVYSFKIIKKIIPYKIRIKVKSKIMSYPRIENSIKKIFYWLKKIDSPNKNFFLKNILPFLIKSLFIPLLKLIIRNQKCSTIISKQLENLLQIQKKTSQLFIHDTYVNQKKLINFSTYWEQNIELSPEALEVYKKLKTTFDYYEINY